MQDQQGEHEQPMTQRSGNPLQNLKIALKAKWDQKGIDICYQKMIQFYLNDMNHEQARLEIFREQEKILSNTSPSFKIEKLKQDRIRIIENLKDLTHDKNNIQNACSCLDQLRKINLKICQSIFSLKQALNKRNIDGGAVSVGYESFFNELNSDNQFLMDSYLNQYINFSKSYDPFFLIPYQAIQASGFPQDTPQPVVRLFKMNISYVYRLIKMKNQLVKCLNYASIVQRNVTFQLENYGRKQSIQGSDSQGGNFRKSMNNNNRKKYGLRRNKYENIPQESGQVEQRRKLSRKVIRSQPKQRTKSVQSSQQQKSQSKRTIKRIKIKQNFDNINNSLPHRLQTENYEIAEDQDINIFRKKMLERRKRRKMIDLRNNREEELNNDLSIPIRRYEIDHKKSLETIQMQDYPQKKYSLNSIKRQESCSQSQEQERVLEPKIIAEAPNRYQRLKLSQQVRTKDALYRRKDRIKLTPLLKNEEQQGDQNNEHGHSLHSIKLKEAYQPLSPQIKEMNKESSSGNNSDQKQSSSDEAYTGKRQQELFMNVSQKTSQLPSPSKPSFRIKKVPNQQNYGESAYKSYMESQSIISPEEKHENKFKDGHIRKVSVSRNQSIGPVNDRQKSPSFRISKKFEDESHKTRTLDLKNDKQSHQFFGNEQKGKTSSFKPIVDVTESSYSGKANISYNNSSSVSKKVQQRILSQIEQQLDESKSKKKQIQMKPGQIKLSDLYSFIQKQKINQVQREQFQVGLWKQNINLKHSYLTKFYMNSELAAFGLSSPRCDGDYSILYWGTTCPQNFTTFLFKKYLDYLQKFTCLNNIYIGSSGYADSDFVKKGSMYVRKRKNFQKRDLPYTPFLSIECSNICFEQQNNSQSSIFFSQQIQQFSKQNARTSEIIGLCDPSLPSSLSLSQSSLSNSNFNSNSNSQSNSISNSNTIADSQKNESQPLTLPSQSNFYNNLSISQINGILQSTQIDTYATSDKIKIQKCRLFTLKDQCSIKSNYFYIRNGYFIPKGYQIYCKDKQKIIKLEMNKQDYSLYFGKKFTSISSFLQNCSPKISGPDYFFAFKMFSKQLYGRLRNPQYEKEGCYGNWDINFLWQDQLKGTVIKDMPSNEYTFGPESFYVALFMNQMLLFGFQVKPSDFFF